MWKRLKTWLYRPFAIAAAAVRGWFRRRGAAPSERWVDGEFSAPEGVLQYAPLLTPKRSYRLHVPVGYNGRSRLPMLVMLHGCKQDPTTFAAGTRMNQFADRESLFVLYPQQRAFANAYRCWNWFDPAAHSGNGEAALIAGMVKKISGEYLVDRERIYVAGLSAGGAMASIMASAHGNLFAACVVHSGLMFRAADSLAEARRAMRQGSRLAPREVARQAVLLAKPDFTMPVMVIHGSVDETVHPINADQVIEQFLAMAEHVPNALPPQASDIDESTFSRSAQGIYTCQVHDYAYRQRFLLRKVIVENMGHAWSGGDDVHPFNDPKGPDANRLIWEFVSQFRRVVVAADTAQIPAGIRSPDVANSKKSA